MMVVILALLAILAHAAGLMLCLSVAVAAAWLCWRAVQVSRATGCVIPVGAFVLCMAAATGALLLLFQVGW